MDLELGRVQPGRCERGAIVRGLDSLGLLLEVFPWPGTSAYEKPNVWLARVRNGILDELALANFMAK